MKNKRSKIANLLKIGVLLLGVSLLLWNCEKDEVVEHYSNNQKKTLEFLNLSDVKDNLTITKIIDKINNQTKLSKSEKQNFSVNTTRILKVVDNKGVETYSFYLYVRKDQNSSFENFVIRKEEDKYDFYLIKYFYDLTKQEFPYTQKRIQIEEEEITNLEEIVSYASKTLELSCGYSSIPYQKDWCTYCDAERFTDGCSDSYNYPEYYTTKTFYTIVYTDCPDSEEETPFEEVNNEDNENHPTSSGETGTTTVGVNFSFEASELIAGLNITNQEVQDWIKDPANYSELTATLNFLDSNKNPDYTYPEETITFANQAIEILSDPILPPNNPIVGYTEKIQKMIIHLRQFGNPEDEFFAEYLESLIPEFTNMTVGDVYDIYKMTKRQVDNLTIKYLEAVVVPFAEAAYPFVVYALTEATLGAALPILARIPKLPVFNSAWVNNLVRQVGVLGIRGEKTYIRVVTTNGNAYSKALELFKGITRNAQSVTIQSNGVRVALFNNGNKIVFRSQSSSGFPATIELTFPHIWSKTRIIKFQ